MEESFSKTGNDVTAWKLENIFSDDNHLLLRLTKDWNTPVCLSLLYILVVFGGRKRMESRKKFDLRFPLIMWSTFLAIFSITGTIRIAPVALRIYRAGGIRGLICDTSFYNEAVGHFWVVMFMYSKFAEYVDTVFIILRKQKLIFLHWYHHLTVALFCWMAYRGRYGGGFIFMIANYFVHSLMYTYYALKASGIKIPRSIAKTITTSQIVQMFIGCGTVIGLACYSKTGNCASSPNFVITGAVMYTSYLILFIDFFYKAYNTNRRPKTTGLSNEVNGSTMKISTPTSQRKRRQSSRSSDYELRNRKPSLAS